MLNGISRIVIALLALAVSSAFAQVQPQKPPLPAVLIIGDSVYQQHAQALKTELKSQATVTFATWPANVLPSSGNAIQQIDLLLGLKDASGNEVPENKRPAWKVIHLNVGLGDLIHHVPGLKSHRSLPYDLGGLITTTAAEYEKNLDALIPLIKKKAPKARIIWASTTPIRSSRSNWFKPGSEVEYNQIAGRVMKKHSIPINDMHAYALAAMDSKKPSDQDPFFFDKHPLHPPIVASILKELKP
jgi:hypothetical protein